MAYEAPDRWQERANCKNKAFELFEYQEKDSPLTKGMKFPERMQFNRVNYERASEICVECPVMLTCGEEATPEEKRWTVRGGLMPTRFLYEMNRYADQGRPRSTPRDRVCQRGHTVIGGGRCMRCKKDGKRARQAANRV